MKSTIKYFFLLLFFIFFIQSMQAQDFISEQGQQDKQPEKKGGFQRERLFFGGNVGFNFSSDYTVIDVNPLVGYRFTDKFSSGIQIDYSFIQISYMDVSTSIYGVSVFASYIFYKNFLAKAEYQHISLESKYFGPSITAKGRFGIDNVYVGGGFRTPIGEHSYAYFLILWNLNETMYNPYQNPIYSISFEF